MRISHDLKNILRDKLGGFFLYLVIRLISITLRWQVTGLKELANYLAEERQTLFALWHDLQLIMPVAYIKYRKSLPSDFQLKALVSGHGDGQLVKATLAYFGLKAVSGSSSRGGVKATLEIQDAIRQGYSIVITPDGPRGPPHQIKEGILFLAENFNLAVVPLVIKYSNSWRLSSWDSFQIPKPFSRVELKIESPIIAVNNSDHFKALIEERLER
jgi:hypothetical protein